MDVDPIDAEDNMDDVVDNDECEVADDILGFFETALDVPPGHFPNPCEVLAHKLICACLEADECVKYRFKEVLGSGLNGLVLDAVYDNVHLRVAKVVLVHADADVPTRKDVGPLRLKTVGRRAFEREVALHKQLMQRQWRTFQVLNVHGEAGVVPIEEDNLAIGVYVMDKLVLRVVGSEVLDDVDLPLPSWLVHVLHQIPHILAELHRAGYVHNDLHLGNVAASRFNFDTKPTLLDFGRCLSLASVPAHHRAALQLYDYTVLLAHLLDYLTYYLGEEEDPRRVARAMAVYNICCTAVHNTQEPRALQPHVEPDMWADLELLFSYLEDPQDAYQRLQRVRYLYFTPLFHTQRWFDLFGSQ